MKAGAVRDILLKRVRQFGGVAITAVFAREILDKCQKILNVGRRYEIVVGILSLKKQRLIYSIKDDIAPDMVDILYIIKDGKHILNAGSLADLSAYDVNWWRKIDGTALELWTQIGRDYLIVYPGLAADASYAIVGSKLTDTLTTINTDLDIPDERVDELLQLAEIILLTRGRQFAEVKLRTEDFLT